MRLVGARLALLEGPMRVPARLLAAASAVCCLVAALLYLRNGLSPSTSHVIEVRSLGTAGHTGGGTRVAIDAVSILR